MAAMSSSSRIDSIFERGSMMSCTVIEPRSNRFSRIDTCFFGMKLEDSSTSVRISAGVSFCTSVLSPGRMPASSSSGRTNRFTNQTPGRSRLRSGPST